MKDSFTIRTSVKPQLMKKILIKGFFLALTGILLLFFGGIFLPEESLQVWGAPLFFTGIAFVTFGLLPFRKLTKLENKPVALTVNAMNEITLERSGMPILTFPQHSIQKIEYVEDPQNYGMAFWFIKPVENPIIVHDNSYKLVTGFDADLFLPYFSTRSVKELKEWLSENDADFYEL